VIENMVGTSRFEPLAPTGKKAYRQWNHRLDGGDGERKGELGLNALAVAQLLSQLNHCLGILSSSRSSDGSSASKSDVA
jgi:hypothetical protein